MPITKRLRLETVDFDNPEEMDAFFNQMLEVGMERVRAEGEELRRRGLLDENGKVLLKELPPDMREGSDRDFGG
jgi:hypothetical protein